MIITVTLSDGTEIQEKINETIKKSDGSFFLFESRNVTVRVETEENIKDRKQRGC